MIPPPIRCAELHWRNGQPWSPSFDDTYFSVEDGPAETRTVFIEANRLAERFASAHDFTIGETGFGSGLNFLVTYALWRKTAGAGARLTYVSFERFPFSRDDLVRAHEAWPELAEEAALLQAHYPDAAPGFQIRHLPENVTLQLGFGEAEWLLPLFAGTCDAWFLDGFAPAKNETMWSAFLLNAIGERTKPGGTASSFTAAGDVRRGLEAARFTVERLPGFGRKRHRIVAKMAGHLEAVKPNHAIVIGGGIAGAAAARALVRRGCRVTLLEADAAAAGGSGNPAAIFFPRLHAQWDAVSRFYFAAYRLALAETGAGEGMVQLPKRQKGTRRPGLSELAAKLGLEAPILGGLSGREASDALGMPTPHDLLAYGDGGSVDLGEWTRSIVETGTWKTRYGQQAISLERQGSGWRVTTRTDSFDGDRVVLANAQGARALLPELPLEPVGGMTSRIPVNGQAGPVIGYGGALVRRDDAWWIGSTFERGNGTSRVDADGHRENRRKLADALPHVADGLAEIGTWSGWAGTRSTSPDRLPLVGEWDAGLLLSVAHGSRGAVSALLAGEMLSAMTTGAPLPVDREVAAMLSPRRYGACRVAD